MDNDVGFGAFLFAATVGAALSFWFFSSHMTWDNEIKTGAEFYLDGSIYSCGVSHKLRDSSQESGKD